MNTTLHDGIILSTLSINSRGFALGFPKDLVPMELVFFDYKPMIIPYLTDVGLSSSNTNNIVCLMTLTEFT